MCGICGEVGNKYGYSVDSLLILNKQATFRLNVGTLVE